MHTDRRAERSSPSRFGHVSGNEQLRLRHLEDIRQVIARLSQNSFMIRGWSVTLVTVIVAFGASRGNASHLPALVALPPTVIFWYLDAYYLHQERLFRHMYRAAARSLTEGASAPTVPLFTMDTAPYEQHVPGHHTTLLSPHVLAIPTMLLIVIALSLVL